MPERLAAGRSFGELLRRYRGEADLSQAELQRRSGVSREAIRSLEAGRRQAPRAATVDQLADALGLSGPQRYEFVAAASPDRGAVVPRELPAAIQDFIGRTAELAQVVNFLTDRAAVTREAAGSGAVVITGPAGSGKTALAVHAAHQVATAFPDGQLFVRLSDPSARPEPRIDGRSVLMVLDDVVDPHQLEAVPGGSAVIVTSRRPLPGLAPGLRVALGGLTSADSLRLLQLVAGEQRYAADPAATAEIVELCAGLPETLRRAAVRLVARPAWTPADLLGWLRADPRRAGGG